jgi:hypothetical protein
MASFAAAPAAARGFVGGFHGGFGGFHGGFGGFHGGGWHGGWGPDYGWGWAGWVGPWWPYVYAWDYAPYPYGCYFIRERVYNRVGHVIGYRKVEVCD